MGTLVREKEGEREIERELGRGENNRESQGEIKKGRKRERAVV